MKHFDLSLYLVIDSQMNPRLNILEIVEEAVFGGVTMVQLRDKKLSVLKIRRLGEALLKILRPKAIPLIVNDSPELAKEIGADGVHLGAKDMDPRRARELLGSNSIIGLSIDSLADYHKLYLSPVDYLGGRSYVLGEGPYVSDEQ